MGSVSRRPFWSAVLGLRSVAVILGGVTGGRERMTILDLRLRIDGGGSGARP